MHIVRTIQNTNTVCRQNAEFLYVKTGGTYRSIGLERDKENINLCFLMPDSSTKMLFLLILIMCSEYSLNIGTNCHECVKETVHKTKLPYMVSILHIKQYSLIVGGGMVATVEHLENNVNQN
jgi:hypothetical protein